MTGGRDLAQKIGRHCRGQQPCLFEKELAVAAWKPSGLIQRPLECAARLVPVEHGLHAGDSQQGGGAHRRLGSFGLLPCARQQIVRHKSSVAD